MKRIAFVAIACIAISACSSGVISTSVDSEDEEQTEDPSSEEPQKPAVSYNYIEEPLDVAWKKTASFKQQEVIGNYWRSPYEFELLGGGDCNDFSGYLIYHLGKAASCRIVRMLDTGRVHAIVEYKGEFLESQVYGMKYSRSDFISYSYLSIDGNIVTSGYLSYDKVMEEATAHYTK